MEIAALPEHVSGRLQSIFVPIEPSVGEVPMSLAEPRVIAAIALLWTSPVRCRRLPGLGTRAALEAAIQEAPFVARMLPEHGLPSGLELRP